MITWAKHSNKFICALPRNGIRITYTHARPWVVKHPRPRSDASFMYILFSDQKVMRFMFTPSFAFLKYFNAISKYYFDRMFMDFFFVYIVAFISKCLIFLKNGQTLELLSRYFPFIPKLNLNLLHLHICFKWKILLALSMIWIYAMAILL